MSSIVNVDIELLCAAIKQVYPDCTDPAELAKADLCIYGVLFDSSDDSQIVLQKWYNACIPMAVSQIYNTLVSSSSSSSSSNQTRSSPASFSSFSSSSSSQPSPCPSPEFRQRVRFEDIEILSKAASDQSWVSHYTRPSNLFTCPVAIHPFSAKHRLCDSMLSWCRFIQDVSTFNKTNQEK
ncbi:MAG TPA: hypothetical protein VEF04_19900 [Blastocatellia bacterium]|nr:hypothetical protein [Blastocatellia bacterium]